MKGNDDKPRRGSQISLVDLVRAVPPNYAKPKITSAEFAVSRLTAVPCHITFAAYGIHFRAVAPTKAAAEAAEIYVCSLRPAAAATLHAAVGKARNVPMTDQERSILRRVTMVLVKHGAKLEAV